MQPTPITSVASAAVIGGDLIIGLSDGSIINCGRVQGPQGLKGDQGSQGATGRGGGEGAGAGGGTHLLPPEQTGGGAQWPPTCPERRAF